MTSEPSRRPEAPRGIQSIEIGARLLRALVEAKDPQPLTRLAAAAGMSASKARMYLVSLIRTELVLQDPSTGLYGLGPFAARIGAAFGATADLRARAEAVMDEVGRVTGSLMLLAGWERDGITLLRQTSGKHRLPIDFRVGGHVPLMRTATGLIVLAFMPEDETRQQLRLELADMRVGGPETIDEGETGRLVEEARASGVATVNSVKLGSGVVLAGYTAVAVPVFDEHQVLRFVITALHPKRGSTMGLADARAFLMGRSTMLSHDEARRVERRV